VWCNVCDTETAFSPPLIVLFEPALISDFVNYHRTHVSVCCACMKVESNLQTNRFVKLCPHDCNIATLSSVKINCD
jgi:hypothetical protein